MLGKTWWIAVGACCALALGGCDEETTPTDGGGTDAAGMDSGGGGDAGTDAGGGGIDGGVCVNDSDCNDMDPCNGDETCPAGSCVAGTNAADGTTCDADGDPGTTDFCIGGSCAPSRCGDGVVDPPEACDDGNPFDGDGCDTGCTLSCTGNPDCDDGEECTGVETCDLTTNACVAGVALTEGADCRSATGICMSMRCVPSVCDDAGDCSDGLVCNGAESCDASMACQLGTALDCDDSNECTADACREPGGCASTLIDGDGDGHSPDSLACGDDCDDADPLTYGGTPGAPDGCGGGDNDCDGTIDEDGSVLYYPDCDRDSYAAPDATGVDSCGRPTDPPTGCLSVGASWTTRAPTDQTSIDCVDINRNVNPGQMMFQTSPIAGQPPASDFDYNCDSIEETAIDAGLAECELSDAMCVFTPGWLGEIPECGSGGRFQPNAMACQLVDIGGPGGPIGFDCMLVPDVPTLLRAQRCR